MPIQISKGAAPYVYAAAFAVVVVTLTDGSVKAVAVALALACNVAYIYARWRREPDSLFFIVLGIFSFTVWAFTYSLAVFLGWAVDPSQL
jgi:hypothetical protein